LSGGKYVAAMPKVREKCPFHEESLILKSCVNPVIQYKVF